MTGVILAVRQCIKQTTGITDYVAICRAMARVIAERGGQPVDIGNQGGDVAPSWVDKQTPFAKVSATLASRFKSGIFNTGSEANGHVYTRVPVCSMHSTAIQW